MESKKKVRKAAPSSSSSSDSESSSSSSSEETRRKQKHRNIRKQQRESSSSSEEETVRKLHKHQAHKKSSARKHSHSAKMRAKLVQSSGKKTARSMSPTSRAAHKHHLKVKMAAKKAKLAQLEEHERRSRTPSRRDVKKDRTPDHRITSPATRIRVSVPNNRAVRERSAARIKDSPSTSRRHIRQPAGEKERAEILARCQERQRERDRMKRLQEEEERFKHGVPRSADRSRLMTTSHAIVPDNHRHDRSRSQSRGKIPIRERLDKEFDYRRSISREHEDYPIIRGSVPGREPISSSYPRERAAPRDEPERNFDYRPDERRVASHDYSQTSRNYDERHHRPQNWENKREIEPRSNRMFENREWEPPVHSKRGADEPYKDPTERSWNDQPHDKWSKEKDPKELNRNMKEPSGSVHHGPPTSAPTIPNKEISMSHPNDNQIFPVGSRVAESILKEFIHLGFFNGMDGRRSRDFNGIPNEIEERVGIDIRPIPNVIIGRGSLYTVYLGSFGYNHRIAVKVATINDGHVAVNRELKTLQMLDSQFVAAFVAFEIRGPYYMLALRLYDSNLQIYLDHHSSPTRSPGFEERRDFFFDVLEQLIKGLDYLHRCRITHRNILPKNILLQVESGKNVIKFSGFKYATLNNEVGGCGSATKWRAPEYERDGIYGKSSDIFTLGCLIFTIFSGDVLTILPTEASFRVFETEDYRLYASKHLIAVMTRCATNLRPVCSDLLRHPVFWSAERYVEFLCDVNGKIIAEGRDNSALGARIDTQLTQEFFGRKGWIRHIGKPIRNRLFSYVADRARNLNRRPHMNYALKGGYVSGLMNSFRASVALFFEFMLDPEIRLLYGKVPERLLTYWTRFTPSLLFRVYQAAYGRFPNDGGLCNDRYFKKYYVNTEFVQQMLGMVVVVTKPVNFLD